MQIMNAVSRNFINTIWISYSFDIKNLLSLEIIFF